MATSERYFYATGRRKTAVARVRLYPGSGEIPSTAAAISMCSRAARTRTPCSRRYARSALPSDGTCRPRVAGGGITGWAGAALARHRPRPCRLPM